MDQCCVCHMGMLASDLPVRCSGCKCSKVYHYKCTTMTKPLAKLVAENVNVVFKCDDCLSSQCCGEQNVLISNVEKFEEEVKKISSLSESISGIRDHVSAKINEMLQNEMEQLGKKVNGTLDEAINGFRELISKELKNMKGSFLEINSRKNSVAMNGNQGSSKPTPGSKRRIVQSDVDETSDNVFMECSSFADAVKQTTVDSQQWVTVRNKIRSNRKKSTKTDDVKESPKARPVIVIKPTESNQSSDDTRKFLNSKLDPKKHKICNFKNGKDGSIIAECATGYNVNVVKDGIQSDLGENYNAVVPSSVPRLKVMGMSEKFSSDDFIRILKEQNEDIAIYDVKVIRMYENPRFKYNKHTVVIEVDKATHGCLLTARKVNIKFDRCSVYPEINILRCFQCGEFGHISMDCKNSARCSKCSESHRTSECTSTVLKCINCIKMNSERNLNLDVNHGAFSFDCEVYQRLFERKKSSLRFNE